MRFYWSLQTAKYLQILISVGQALVLCQCFAVHAVTPAVDALGRSTTFTLSCFTGRASVIWKKHYEGHLGTRQLLTTNCSNVSITNQKCNNTTRSRWSQLKVKQNEQKANIEYTCFTNKPHSPQCQWIISAKICTIISSQNKNYCEFRQSFSWPLDSSSTINELMQFKLIHSTPKFPIIETSQFLTFPDYSEGSEKWVNGNTTFSLISAFNDMPWYRELRASHMVCITLIFLMANITSEFVMSFLDNNTKGVIFIPSLAKMKLISRCCKNNEPLLRAIRGLSARMCCMIFVSAFSVLIYSILQENIKELPTIALVGIFYGSMLHTHVVLLNCVRSKAFVQLMRGSCHVLLITIFIIFLVLFYFLLFYVYQWKYFDIIADGGRTEYDKITLFWRSMSEVIGIIFSEILGVSCIWIFTANVRFLIAYTITLDDENCVLDISANNLAINNQV